MFPLLMLLQMTSAGAMGGGVSSAIARALGSGDAASARRLVVHSLVIALAMGGVFTVVLISFGAAVCRLLGASGESLDHALRYSGIVFSGAVGVWIANTLSSVLRGTGNMLVPALALIAAALVHVPLSGSLTLGLGRMALFVFRPSNALRPRRGDLRLERRLFAEILRVGGISVVSSFQTVLTAVVITGFVGRHGTAALAGYGVGLRLELLQIPLVFAVGQAMVVLVGIHIGARRAARAKRIAWVGGALASCTSLAIGVTVSLVPLAWVGLFSADPDVLDSGSRYLRTVAPFYPLLAAGIALYFAAQGAGRVLWPVLAGTVRLGLVIAGGALMVSLQGVFAVIAAAMAAFGLLTLWFVARADWTSG